MVDCGRDPDKGLDGVFVLRPLLQRRGGFVPILLAVAQLSLRWPVFAIMNVYHSMFISRILGIPSRVRIVLVFSQQGVSLEKKVRYGLTNMPCFVFVRAFGFRGKYLVFP
jgi:hypothetical protein